MTKTPFRLNALLNGFLICALLILSINTFAGSAIKHGAVMARAMVLDDQGQPILVEFNEDGSEAGVVNYGEDFSA